ncbi:hypothetical protein MCOR30_009680 [Pyricularia oryzae]|nr:hypothetical protein MCOR30_009680 [Pyricularia oryzae]
MAPIKVGIVGYGFSTKCFHLPYILPNPDLQVYAFLQRAEAPPKGSGAEAQDAHGKMTIRGGHCTVEFPDAKHYRTANEFFGDQAIELVVICTPNHEEFVKGALDSGKHVVVEKPFVTTSEGADRLIELAREKKRVLTVFHNRRFDSDFLTLKYLLSEGALGDVRDAQIHFDFPDPSWIGGWTQKEYVPGEGMAFGLGSHTIDQALALFGTPSFVTGFFASNRGVDSDVDDTFTIVMQYSGNSTSKNLLVTVKTTIITPMRDQLNESRKASPDDHGVEDERAWGDLITKVQFDAASQSFDESTELWTGKYPSLPGYCRGYYENVVHAIRGSVDVEVRPEMARDGLRVIELARNSHEKGVKVPWS